MSLRCVALVKHPRRVATGAGVVLAKDRIGFVLTLRLVVLKADLHGIVRRKVQRVLRNQLPVEVKLEVVVAVDVAGDVLGSRDLCSGFHQPSAKRKEQNKAQATSLQITPLHPLHPVDCHDHFHTGSVLESRRRAGVHPKP